MIIILLLYFSLIVILTKENKQYLSLKPKQESKANIGTVSLTQFKNHFQFQSSQPKGSDKYPNIPSVDLSSFQNMLHNNSSNMVNKIPSKNVMTPNNPSSFKTSSSKDIDKTIQLLNTAVKKNQSSNMIDNLIQMSSDLMTLMNKVVGNFPESHAKQSANNISNNITQNLTNKLNVNNKIKPVSIPPQFTNFRQINQNLPPLNQQIIRIDKSNCIRLPDGRLAYIIPQSDQPKNNYANWQKGKNQSKSKSKSSKKKGEK